MSSVFHLCISSVPADFYQPYLELTCLPKKDNRTFLKSSLVAANEQIQEMPGFLYVFN